METNIKHEKIKEFVKKELTCSAHNLDHVFRVYKLCLKIAECEKNADIDVLIPAALLHDIARVKESSDLTGEIDHAVLGGTMAEEILRKLDYDKEEIEKIKHCITAHRFRTGNEPQTIEAKILYDADKLDAIGAIGIARCFMLGGQFGQSLSINEGIEDYLNSNSVENGRLKNVSKHTPIIEYEIKLKRIPEKLYTEKAKQIASERMKYMDGFFEKLNLEMNGIE